MSNIEMHLTNSTANLNMNNSDYMFNMAPCAIDQLSPSTSSVDEQTFLYVNHNGSNFINAICSGNPLSLNPPNVSNNFQFSSCSRKTDVKNEVLPNLHQQNYPNHIKNGMPSMKMSGENRKQEKPKRKRTQFTSEHLLKLENYFKTSQYIDRQKRIEISMELNLCEKQIKIWFQNRRMKCKNESKKSKKTMKNQRVETVTETFQDLNLIELEMQPPHQQHRNLVNFSDARCHQLNYLNNITQQYGQLPAPPSYFDHQNLMASKHMPSSSISSISSSSISPFSSHSSTDSLYSDSFQQQQMDLDSPYYNFGLPLPDNTYYEPLSSQ